MNNLSNHYQLKCVQCNSIFEDTDGNFLLNCSNEHPSLLRTLYSSEQLNIKPELPGILRYRDWLPVRRSIKKATAPAVFLSKELGHHLKLNNLYILFNGYWPEKGAFMESCTFKELEAPGVCCRIGAEEEKTLVVASAGNTGRAFIQFCSDNNIPALIVVPHAGIKSLWGVKDIQPCVKIAVLKGNVDYYDAIQLADKIAGLDGFFSEGGAKNTGRRDGMGTSFLTAAETIGTIPDHYFQAVGSGTGGIAAWEANIRLLSDGRFGNVKTQLHLAQNDPFTIMFDAWAKGSRDIRCWSDREAKKRIKTVRAHVLSNRKPPYSIRGGVYDALMDTSGTMYSVTNEEAKRAGDIFLKKEGCDLDPAAEVALAALFQAVEMKKFQKKDLVVLNITGGGFKKLAGKERIKYYKPDWELSLKDIKSDILIDKLVDEKEAVSI